MVAAARERQTSHRRRSRRHEDPRRVSRRRRAGACSERGGDADRLPGGAAGGDRRGDRAARARRSRRARPRGPSVVDPSTGVALGSINIPLADVALAEDFGRRFGVPVAVENDANVAALAEWKLGAGRGRSSLVMLTLGTGVGGGIVLDGALYRGWAELGTWSSSRTAASSGQLHRPRHWRRSRPATRPTAPPCGSGARARRRSSSSPGPRRGMRRRSRRLREMGRLLGAASAAWQHVRPRALRRRRRLRPRRGAVPLPARTRDGAARGARTGPGGLRIVPAELGGEAGLVGAGLLALEAS